MKARLCSASRALIESAETCHMRNVGYGKRSKIQVRESLLQLPKGSCDFLIGVGSLLACALQLLLLIKESQGLVAEPDEVLISRLRIEVNRVGTSSLDIVFS